MVWHLDSERLGFGAGKFKKVWLMTIICLVVSKALPVVIERELGRDSHQQGMRSVHDCSLFMKTVSSQIHMQHQPPWYFCPFSHGGDLTTPHVKPHSQKYPSSKPQSEMPTSREKAKACMRVSPCADAHTQHIHTHTHTHTHTGDTYLACLPTTRKT
jgi:hypothetical protein